MYRFHNRIVKTVAWWLRVNEYVKLPFFLAWFLSICAVMNLIGLPLADETSLESAVWLISAVMMMGYSCKALEDARRLNDGTFI